MSSPEQVPPLSEWSLELSDGIRVSIAPDQAPSLRQDLKRWLESGEELKTITVTRRSRVSRARSSAGLPVVVKEYRDEGFLGFRTLFQTSRVLRETRSLQAAARDAENPIRVLGWATRRRGVSLHSVIVTAELEDSISLRQVEELTDEQRQTLIRGVAALVVRLHRAKIYAITLFGKNILYQPATETVAVIDLPRARVGRVLSLRQRLDDLAALGCDSRRGLSDEDWRSLLRQVDEKMPFGMPLDQAEEKINTAIDRHNRKSPLRRIYRPFAVAFRRSWIGSLVGANRVFKESESDSVKSPA